MGEVAIGASDWRQVAELVAPFAYDDEHIGPGHVHLLASEGSATWSAGGGNHWVSLRTSCGEGFVDTLLPPRIVAAAARQAAVSDAVTVSSEGPGAILRVGDSTVAFELSLPQLQPLDVGEVLARVRSQPSVAVTVGLRELREVVEIAALAPTCNQRGEDHRAPLLWMEVATNRLMFSVEWLGMGTATYSVAASGEASARVAVSPGHLSRFCNAIDAEDVVLSLPVVKGGSLMVEAGDWVAVTSPMLTGVERHRFRVEQVLNEVFGPGSTLRDDDGDYRLPVGRTATFARLEDGPARLQVFAIALAGVPMSEALLVELNDQNAGLSFVRTFWVDDQVLVEGDVMADALDPEALVTTCKSVEILASQIAPILASMFGGTPGPDAWGGGEWLWRRFAETIISVEVDPGRWADLNGPACVEQIPFGEPLHVLSAANPGGRASSSPEEDERAQGALVAELWKSSDLTIARAEGRSPDGSHVEEAVAVVGLDRDAARRIGARYGQEAVFEVDATTVSVVSCESDRVDALPRRGSATPGPLLGSGEDQP